MNKASIKTTIHIIEDSQIHSEWMNKQLRSENEFNVASISASGHSGIRAIKQYHPDILLLDFQLPDVTGLEVAKRAKAHSDKIKIFALTAHTETMIIERIMSDKNIDAIAIKDSYYFENNFISAIKLVAKGESYVDPSLLQIFRKTKNMDDLGKLTKREFEVLVQLGYEKSDSSIAEDLSVETSHIKNLKSRIYKKIRRKEIRFITEKLAENRSL